MDGAGQPVNQENGAELLLWEHLRAPQSTEILGRYSAGTAGRSRRAQCLKEAVTCRGWMQALGASHPALQCEVEWLAQGACQAGWIIIAFSPDIVPCSWKWTVKSALSLQSGLLYHCHQSKGWEGDWLYLGSVWGPCHHLLWWPGPSGSHLNAKPIPVLFIFTADHLLSFTFIQDFTLQAVLIGGTAALLS